MNFSEIQQFTPPEDFGTAYTSKSYDRKYTKNYSVYNASGCTFLGQNELWYRSFNQHVIVTNFHASDVL